MEYKFILSLLISLLAGLSTLIGYFIIYIKVKNINKFLSFFLTLSFSIMINISIFELIPHATIYFLNKYNFILIITIITFIFTISQILVKRVGEIVNKKVKIHSNLYNIGILSTIVLFMHNMPEGVATFISSYNNLKLGITLSFSIIMHNIPEGINIALPIYYATHSKRNAFKYVFICALAEPIGALLAYLLLYNINSDYLLNITLLIVSGIMLSISINEIFPESIKYNNGKLNKKAYFLGMLFVILSLLIF
jgi:zinc transporter, ZIP family